MSSRRFVFLDPDGTSGGGWLYVVVEAKTGVFYQQQYGGTACRQGQVEGFLVPLVGPGELDALRVLFEKDFRGAGTWDYAWPDDKRDRLREITGTIRPGHATGPPRSRMACGWTRAGSGRPTRRGCR